MSIQNEHGVVVYGVIYLLALGIAVWRRKAFPLGGALGVLVVVGIGFTGLIYLIVPQSPIPSPPPAVESTEFFRAGLSCIHHRALVAQKITFVCSG